MDETTVLYLRRKWYTYDGSVREFLEHVDVGISRKALSDLLEGRSYKSIPVLGKASSIEYKRIPNPNKPLPHTNLYINGGKNNYADMIVAYYVQQGNQRACNMLYSKFHGLARHIVSKMMFKKSSGEFTNSDKIEDMTSDAMAALFVQICKSYRPHDASVFNSYFTSVIKNSVKTSLTKQTASEDYLDALPDTYKASAEDWNHVKSTDSVQ